MPQEQVGVGASSKTQKCRVVLRGDAVKDDSGSCAALTEQGSSASQMTAAKVMDVISRLPGSGGQASDAASAYNHVKMENAPKSSKLPQLECPIVLLSSTSIPLTKNSVQSSGTCATLLKGICADNHWLGLRWEHLLHLLIRSQVFMQFLFGALCVLYFSPDFFCSPFFA